MSWKQNSCFLGNFLWSQVEWSLINMDQEWPKILQWYVILSGSWLKFSISVSLYMWLFLFRKFCYEEFLYNFLRFVSTVDSQILNWKWTENRENLLDSFFFFWLHHTACRVLVPRPGIEPMPRAVEVQSRNHWTAREVPRFLIKWFTEISFSGSLKIYLYVKRDGYLHIVISPAFFPTSFSIS